MVRGTISEWISFCLETSSKVSQGSIPYGAGCVLGCFGAGLLLTSPQVIGIVRSRVKHGMTGWVVRDDIRVGTG